MDNSVTTVFTVASWEDRFRLGLSKILSDNPTISTVVMFYYVEYAEWTEPNRNFVQAMCLEQNITLCQLELSFENPVLSWRIIEACICDKPDYKYSLIDISTMPRDTIWAILHFLSTITEIAQYIYFKPESYNQDWLSRDPTRPRLAFKNSGIVRLGTPTLLIVATGFDSERTEQLITYLEPKKTILAIQQGKQFGNEELNLDKHQLLMKTYSDITAISVDSYSYDHGFSIYDGIVNSFKNDYNIVLSSLGPKPSAVAFFRLIAKYPEIALIYAPSGQFNRDYSWGIGASFNGSISFKDDSK